MKACAVVSQAFLAGTCVMALIVALTLIFPTSISRLLGSSDHLMPLAIDYLCWLMPGILFLVWSCIGMMTIRLDGSPNYAMMINIVPAVLNIIGDYILIFPCGMGVKEAAIATAGSIACYLFPLMFMMSNAVAQSAQPIISYNFGNHADERVTAAFLLSLRVALLCGAIVTISIFFLSGGIVGLFIPVDSEAGTLAVHGLPIFSFCAIFFALNIAYIGYYQSIGKAARAMTYTLLRGVILLVPLFFLLPSLFPSWGMWAAIPASELCTFLIILSGRVARHA